MPPFGFEKERWGLFQTTVSTVEDDIDSSIGDNGIGSSRVLKDLLQRFEDESVPIELSCALQDLFKKATQFGERVRQKSHHIVMGNAVDRSIRIELTEVLDQVALLFEMEGDKRRIVGALTSTSINQALHYFQKLESMILEVDTKKLEPFLNGFSKIDEEFPPIRVSLLSSALAFEFVAGKTDIATLSSYYGGNGDDLGVIVKATPYLVVKSNIISDQSNLLSKYGDCRLKIEYCSHKTSFASSSSGVMGEATVRIHVISGKEVKIPKEGTVWSLLRDCDRLNISQVRVVQTNSYHRNVQTSLDLYKSTMHGQSGFIVTVKMKTHKSFNNGIPDFDIQLIMELPTSLQ